MEHDNSVLKGTAVVLCQTRRANCCVKFARHQESLEPKREESVGVGCGASVQLSEPIDHILGTLSQTLGRIQ
jgi:hypothetical protein